VSQPNWRRFSQIAFTAETAAVLKALDIDVPPEGRPVAFSGPDGFIAARQEGPAGEQWLVWKQPGGTRFVATADEVRQAARLPAGTPSGEALRQWLSWWGWVPAKKRAAEPPPPPMVI
jgi:hypothetical protein